MTEGEYRALNCRVLPLIDAAAVAQVQSMSVVICASTVRRWGDLGRAVDSVLSEPMELLDVIVVIDHCDELYALAERRFGTDGRITLCRNAGTAGLSDARNTGVGLATGDVVAFLGDDAAVQPGWARALISHYGDPGVAAVGGYAAPVWPGERPRWLPREFDWVVGCNYVGQPTAVAAVRNPLGCNMSVRRDVLTKIGAFRPEVGRVGSARVGGEEIELFIRLRTLMPAGRVLFDPDAAVRHHVASDRVTIKYFARRCYYQGVSKAVVTELASAPGSLKGERDYALRVLPRAVVRETFSMTGPGMARAAMVLAGLAITTAGYLRGKLSQPFRNGPR